MVLRHLTVLSGPFGLPAHAGTANDMKTGELTHRGQAAVDNENFEPVKADTFEGLGLPKSLADHLEGPSILPCTMRCMCHTSEGDCPSGHRPALNPELACSFQIAAMLLLLRRDQLHVSPTRVQQAGHPLRCW